MRPERVLAITGLAMLALYLAAMGIFRKPDGRVIFGDATHHYVQLRSLVFDRDLDFENDYLGMYGVKAGDPGTEWLDRARTPTGRVRNLMPIGPALLWLPLYLAATAVGAALALVGLAAPPDGFNRWLQLVPGVTGVAAATIAAILSYRLATRHDDARTALLATLGIWIGTHALYYTLVSPTYSHAPSMLAAAVFFTHWAARRVSWTTGDLALSGALAGVAALMRWQDAILLVVPALEACRQNGPAARRFAGAAAAAAAFLAAFSPQMAVWTVLYGQPLAIPQGASFMQWTSPHPLAVLVSDNHGLFSWSPLLVPAVVGLVAATWRRSGAAWPILPVVLLSWYANAAVTDWWAGEAFGARRFLSLFPLFVMGLSHALGRLQARCGGIRTPLVLVAAFTGGNVLLLLQYQLFMKGLTAIAPYPEGWVDLYLTRFVVPVRLIARWLG